MPASWSFAEKEKLLIKAFHEGAVVIFDEINSSPIMEKLLNQLLMGHYEGERARKPGFMLIGTQNPISMAGRRVPSTAFARRMTSVTLPNYTPKEMSDILQRKGLSELATKDLIAAYQRQTYYAQQHRLNPAPTFRHVLELADKLRSSEAALSLNPVKNTLLSAAQVAQIKELIVIIEIGRHGFFSSRIKDNADALKLLLDTEPKSGATLDSMVEGVLQLYDLMEGRKIDEGSRSMELFKSLAPKLPRFQGADAFKPSSATPMPSPG
jgi:hypothetical protein